MRGGLPTGMFVLLLLSLQPVVAQSGPSPVLTDATEDVVASAMGNPVDPGPPGRFQALDLTSLEVEETLDEIAVTLGVADLDPAGEVYIIDDSVYYIVFTHHDQTYAVQIFRALAEQQYYWSNLFKFDPDRDGFNFIRNMAVEADTSTDAMTVRIAREDLLDAEGAAPFPGRRLTDFAAYAHLRTNEGFVNVNGVLLGDQADAYDSMPDEGTDGAFSIRLGLEQSGHAALSSLSPMRASNGEATTFVYSVRAENTGSEEDLFELVPIDPPIDWQVVVPDRFLRLAGGESVEVPIIITTPFSHQHGDVKTFRIELRSTSDSGSTGRLDVGVRYHAVPQPAGHHDELWIHSQRFGDENQLFVVTDNLFAGNGGITYMNTLIDDEQDQKVPVKGTYWGYGYHDGFNGPEDGEPKSLWRWFIYLQPGLEMGLDFDLSRTGTISLPIQTEVPLPQASLSGELLHWSYDEVAAQWTRTVVADLIRTAPADLLPGAPETFTFDIEVHPESDRLQYTKRAFFGFEFNLTSARPAMFTGVEAPSLLPGGALSLPLLEYRDEVDESFTALGDIMFHAEGAQEKRVAPGSSALLETVLANHLDEEVVFRIALDGVHSEWAQLLGPEHITVGAGETAPLYVAVAIPADAEDGDVADLIIRAEASDDATLRALVRLVAVVDGASDVNDAAAIAALQGHESEAAPSAGALLPLLIAVAVAFARRR